ncbi:MAG TPA: sugar transferase [Nocardioides sp.]
MTRRAVQAARGPARHPGGARARRWWLDELPQLVNVARGEMALVGPRPALPAEVERYPLEMHRRLTVRPGITGLWQVSGRSDLPWAESMRLDCTLPTTGRSTSTCASSRARSARC